MNKATLQAAGTVALGVAIAAAVAGPAAADPLGGLPQVSSLTGEASSLTAPAGGLHDVTSTAQGLINNTAPTVQNATSQLPISSTRSVPQHRDGLPVGNLGGLPGTDQLTGGVGHALDALHGLPVKAPSVN